MVGRVAEYGERDATGFAIRLPQDLSANLKYSVALGTFKPGLRVAAGINDVAGGGSWFRGRYLVATQAFEKVGPLASVSASIGWGYYGGRTRVPGGRGTLDGLFGGVSATVLERPSVGALTAHAEFDGRQPLAGLRFRSAAVPMLGHASVNTSLMQTAARGPMPAALAWSMGLSMPFGARERALEPSQAPARTAAVEKPEPAGPMAALAAARQRLMAAGLEAIRVGRTAEGGWVVHHQNRRFGANEVDALGVVTGIAAQMAPPEVRTLMVVAHKQRQPVFTLETVAAAWREFLHTGASGLAAASTRTQRGAPPPSLQVDWLHDEASPVTPLQLQLFPQLNYTVATEFSVFDYSLAARLRATAPLPWPGTQLVATLQGPVAKSDNVRSSGAFRDLMQESGLQTLAVHQTVWLGERAVLGRAVGRFEYGAFGAEGEAILFRPGSDDTLRVRGRMLERTPGMPKGFDRSGSTLYRWVPAPGLWLEGGYQRYTDGSAGPSFTLTRWWGDLGVSLSYRKGNESQFAGLALSFPLTPRAGLRHNRWLHVEGAPSYRQGVRTRVGSPNNWVTPRAVRDMELAWDIESQALNGGRLGPDETLARLPRMRQAWLLFGSEHAR